MKIGIDFDNTIVNTNEVSKRYLDEFKPNNTLKSYHDLPYDEEINFFLKYYLLITKGLSLFPDVKKAFEIMKKNNIKLFLVTRRGLPDGLLIEPTEKFLTENGLVFDKKIYKAEHKGQICKENGIDLMIDDNDGVIDDVINHGVKVLKYGSKSQKCDYALNWQEVIDYLRKEYKCE